MPKREQREIPGPGGDGASPRASSSRRMETHPLPGLLRMPFRQSSLGAEVELGPAADTLDWLLQAGEPHPLRRNRRHGLSRSSLILWTLSKSASSSTAS